MRYSSLRARSSPRSTSVSARDAGAEPVSGETELLPLQEARAQAAERFERVYLEQLLRRAEGLMAEAARLSGVSRQLLHRLLTRHGIERESFLM